MSVLDLHKFWSAHFSWSGLRRSVAATLALGLALGCALASSVAAQEGNVGTAIVLAVLALLLATVISLTVVPRLALRVRRDWPGFAPHRGLGQRPAREDQARCSRLAGLEPRIIPTVHFW